jgi:carbon storage regulator
MLVLTRRIGETIVIGGNIRVTVVSIQGDRIRLGVSAPTSVPVHREEVHERQAVHNRRNAFVAPPDPLEMTPPPWEKGIDQLVQLPPAANE